MGAEKRDEGFIKGVCSDSEITSVVPIKDDPINNPSHYTDGKIEVIDFILDKNLPYCLGNVLKYIARAGKKDPSKRLEDLKKAAWYLNHQIEIEEKG